VVHATEEEEEEEEVKACDIKELLCK